MKCWLEKSEWSDKTVIEKGSMYIIFLTSSFIFCFRFISESLEEFVQDEDYQVSSCLGSSLAMLLKTDAYVLRRTLSLKPMI